MRRQRAALQVRAVPSILLHRTTASLTSTRRASRLAFTSSQAPQSSELVFFADAQDYNIFDFEGPGVAMGMYNTEHAIRGFALSCFEYALDKQWCGRRLPWRGFCRFLLSCFVVVFFGGGGVPTTVIATMEIAAG